MQALKPVAAFVGIVLLFVGFIALALSLSWHENYDKAHCPSYYNAVYGCSAPLSEGGR